MAALVARNLLKGENKDKEISVADLRLPAIQILQGSSNYDSWKFDLECILIHDHLLKYVEHSPKPDDIVAIREDQKARTKI